MIRRIMFDPDFFYENAAEGFLGYLQPLGLDDVLMLD